MAEALRRIYILSFYPVLLAGSSRFMLAFLTTDPLLFISVRANNDNGGFHEAHLRVLLYCRGFPPFP